MEEKKYFSYSVHSAHGKECCINHFVLPDSIRYEEGDIVLFHPVRLQRSKSTAPVVLHLEKPKPYIFMDHSSFPTFNIRPGRM